MLNPRRMVPNNHHFVMRTDSGDMSAAERSEGGADEPRAGGPRERRHLQSVDSNHMESQSEWSDDDLGRDGKWMERGGEIVLV